MYNNNHLECGILTINDNINNANYSKFIDSSNRENKNYVYVSVVKFQALIPIINPVGGIINNDRPSPIILEIKEARNVYYNESESNFAVRSSIVDTFASNIVIDDKSYHNYENSRKKWIKLNASSLHSLNIGFKTCTKYVDSANSIKYVDFDNFPFNLQLEFKFES